MMDGLNGFQTCERLKSAEATRAIPVIFLTALTDTDIKVRAFLKRMHERERETIALERRHKVAAVVLGVCVGFVLGVTSAGSGALIAVGLILLFRLIPTRVVGTDVFHAAILLWAAAAAHVVAGNVATARRFVTVSNGGTTTVTAMPSPGANTVSGLTATLGNAANAWPSACAYSTGAAWMTI
jgi:uncharacterized membrane protein YfcA